MKKTIITLASLLLAGTLFAQSKPQTKRQESAGVNLSLWKNIATQRNDTVGRTILNIGLFSAMNRLTGVGVNAIGAVTKRDAVGLQVAGISHIVGGKVQGLQVAGITNVNGSQVQGISLSGLVNITAQQADGLTGAALVNIVGEDMRGASLGGLLNIVSKEASGVHVGGIALISERQKGLNVGGLVNVNSDRLQGVQIAGLGNITSHFQGAQIALCNVAVRARGLQIGLINYYKDNLDGFQIGLVNANPHTRLQLMAYGGTATLANVAVKFKNELFYTVLGMGFYPIEERTHFSASALYRAGLEYPIAPQWYISGDLGYQHIETFRNHHHGLPARLYSLQARVNLTYHFNNRWGLFVSGGYGGERHYGRNLTHSKGVIAEAGVVVLKL